MDNPEYIFQMLEVFSKVKSKEIPRELEEYIAYVARTGDPVFQWSLVKVLLKEKLLAVLDDFFEENPSLDIPPCPNVDPFDYENMKSFLINRLESFGSPPFTIQRICELLSAPRKEYSRIDKYMRAVEKNVLVVTSREVFLKRGAPDSDGPGDSVLNGIWYGNKENSFSSNHIYDDDENDLEEERINGPAENVQQILTEWNGNTEENDQPLVTDNFDSGKHGGDLQCDKTDTDAEIFMEQEQEPSEVEHQLENIITTGDDETDKIAEPGNEEPVKQEETKKEEIVLEQKESGTGITIEELSCEEMLDEKLLEDDVVESETVTIVMVDKKEGEESIESTVDSSTNIADSSLDMSIDIVIEEAFEEQLKSPENMESQNDSDIVIEHDFQAQEEPDNIEAEIEEDALIANEVNIMLPNEENAEVASKESAVVVNEDGGVVTSEEGSVGANEENEVVANEENEVVANEENEVVANEDCAVVESMMVTNDESAMVINEESLMVANEESVAFPINEIVECGQNNDMPLEITSDIVSDELAVVEKDCCEIVDKEKATETVYQVECENLTTEEDSVTVPKYIEEIEQNEKPDVPQKLEVIEELEQIEEEKPQYTAKETIDKITDEDYDDKNVGD